MKEYKERIGEVNENRYGTKMKIIKYKNSNNIIVKFLDEYGFEKVSTYKNFKKRFYKKSI